MRVLIDANVLISAAINPSGPPGKVVAMLLRHAAFELVLSLAIVAEVEVALSLPKVRKYLRDPDEALPWLADLVALADLVTDTGAVKGVCRDPDDEVVLAAAVEGRVTHIVTGDDDLLALGAHDGIDIVAPRAFVDLIK